MIAIRFDGPPGPGDESGRFIEVERDGASIEFGEWKQDGEYWLLELTEVAQLEAENVFLLSCIEEGQICESCHRVATKTTHDGVDVCHICWGEMAADAAEAALEAGSDDEPAD